MAKAKVIIRVEKIKTAGNLAGSVGHDMRVESKRELYFPDADAKRVQDNEYMVRSLNRETGEYELKSVARPEDERKLFKAADNTERNKDRVLAQHHEILKDLRKQKHSTIALDYLVSASPETFCDPEKFDRERQDAYFKDALDWIVKRHGGEKYVLSVAIHRDEESPHMHVHVVPRAIQKDRYGHEYDTLTIQPYQGNKHQLVQLQTDFAEQVGKKYGLERGEFRSNAHHKRPKQWVEEQARELAKQALEIAEKEQQISPAWEEAKGAEKHFKTMVAGQQEYEQRREGELAARQGQLDEWESNLAQLIDREVQRSLRKAVEKEIQPYRDLVAAVANAPDQATADREWNKLIQLAFPQERQQDFGIGD